MSFFDPSSSGTLAAGDVLNTVVDTINKARVAAKHVKTSSLVDVTSVARVEPLVIIDADSFNSENIGQVMQCAHNIFTGYYLQAISLIGTVGKINVVKTLDKLNPNRTSNKAEFLNQVIVDVATEDHKDHFNLSLESFNLPNYALEAKGQPASDGVKVSEKATATAQEMSNLSYGKLIDVTITDQGNSLTIPISIRLIANELPQSSILRLLSLQGLERGFVERFWKWRAGRITFIKDLILMQDLIREDKKAMMDDKNGVLDEIFKRARNNKLAGFFSKNASMNEAANIVIFSEETAKQLKLKHNIDVDNFKQRQTVFDSSYSMIMVKVDREWERVTFYISGQTLGSSMSKSELKGNSSKGSGTDLVEIFRALKGSETASLF